MPDTMLLPLPALLSSDHLTFDEPKKEAPSSPVQDEKDRAFTGEQSSGGTTPAALSALTAFSTEVRALLPPTVDIQRHIECCAPLTLPLSGTLLLPPASADVLLRPMVSLPLLARFLALHEEYSNRGFGQVEIAYHGTKLEAAASIQEHGFVMPGTVHPATGQRHWQDRCGTLGRGLYLSRHFSVCSRYAGHGGVILVCLVLLGRQLLCHDEGALAMIRASGQQQAGYDSHVIEASTKYLPQLCLFEPAAVLPIYLATLQ